MLGRDSKLGHGAWLLAFVATGLAIAFAIRSMNGPSSVGTSSAPVERAIPTRLERADEDVFPMDPGSPESRIPLGVVRTGAIEGIVSDLSGAILPPGSARIEAVHQNGSRVSRGLPPEGGYELRGLALGRWSVRAHLGRFAGNSVEVELTTPRPRARADLLVERTRAVHVLLRTPSGSSLEEELATSDVRICAFPHLVAREQPGEFPPHDCSGAFLGPARDTLLRSSAEHAMRVAAMLGDRVLDEHVISPSDQTVALVVDSERLLAELPRLTLRLVDAESGVALRGGRVRLDAGNGARCDFDAGEDGQLSIGHAPIGDFVLGVEAAGRERRILRLHLLPAESRDLGPVALRRGWRAEGLVLGPGGKPCSVDLSISRKDEGGAWILLEDDFEVRSSTSGRFAVDGLGSGRYRIGRGTDHDPWTEFQIDSGPALDLRVEVVPP